MATAYKIAVLPGDGIGPEVMAEALKVLQRVSEKFGHQFEFNQQLVGGAAIDAKGKALPEDTVAACEAAVGLAMVIALFRKYGTVNTDILRLLRG
jgi:3-isopropylmalate dehydrogenase